VDLDDPTDRGLCGGLVGLDEDGRLFCCTNMLPITSVRGLGGCKTGAAGETICDIDLEFFKTELNG
jgi:hypothetical protein